MLRLPSFPALPPSSSLHPRPSPPPSPPPPEDDGRCGPVPVPSSSLQGVDAGHPRRAQAQPHGRAAGPRLHPRQHRNHPDAQQHSGHRNVAPAARSTALLLLLLVVVRPADRRRCSQQRRRQRAGRVEEGAARCRSRSRSGEAGQGREQGGAVGCTRCRPVRTTPSLAGDSPFSLSDPSLTCVSLALCLCPCAALTTMLPPLDAPACKPRSTQRGAAHTPLPPPQQPHRTLVRKPPDLFLPFPLSPAPFSSPSLLPPVQSAVGVVAPDRQSAARGVGRCA